MVGETGGNDYNYAFLQGKSIEDATALVPLVVNNIRDVAKYLQNALQQLRLEYPNVAILYVDYYQASEWVLTNAPQLARRFNPVGILATITCSSPRRLLADVNGGSPRQRWLTGVGDPWRRCVMFVNK
ncbi:hypothetical protein IFM89_030808 [Coptis chinensis]|uniref:GDSL esterase/lipase n=1 Tax=Coptis chinensis TaxID=261450 RepID=A0A835HVU8_9MAGN|nr:hypothetical protein IFM89_030808 [Coptis chinensis]